MAAKIMRNAGIWLREYDFQGSSNAAQWNLEADAQECTPFGATSRVYAMGLPRAPYSFSGYPTNDAADLALFTLAGQTDLTLTMSEEKQVASVAFVGKVLDAQFSTTWDHGAVRTFQSNGEMVDRSFGRGRIMHLGTAVAVTGQGVAQELRAITDDTKQAFATLHVTAMTGTPSFVGRIESDNAVGFPTPTTRATFTAVTNTPAFGSELETIVGPVTDTFWRFAWIITGTGTVTFAAALGFEEPV